MTAFSLARFWAMLGKEWLEMRRDRGTVMLTMLLPIIQLFLFGYAINTNPHHLPTGLIAADPSRYERGIIQALTNTDYFNVRRYANEATMDEALRRGVIMFALKIPPDFARAVDRGESPDVLMEVDATDPTAVGAATAALEAIVPGAITRDLPVRLRFPPPPAFRITIHDRYNPGQVTALNIVPGLIGTILTFSTLVFMAMAITRERETGTMETLLAMPVTPIEVMLGKIVPYIGLGYAQATLILLVAYFIFDVPIAGSLPLLVLCLGVFIACNLALGFTFSSLARTQMQAQQLAQFVLLPSLLLSGFLFPFAGMPRWARIIGEGLPLTHIVRICRGVLLKGNGLRDVTPDLWPMALFALLVGVVAVRTYRTTLD